MFNMILDCIDTICLYAFERLDYYYYYHYYVCSRTELLTHFLNNCNSLSEPGLLLLFLLLLLLLLSLLLLLLSLLLSLLLLLLLIQLLSILL